MNIKEYWARLVVANLAPDWKNVIAVLGATNQWLLSNCEPFPEIIETPRIIGIKDDTEIQLRKDGVDLYKLEWRKPTEEDIGKMCWFYDGYYKNWNYGILYNITLLYYPENTNVKKTNHHQGWGRCLLADHGQIAPTEQDFIEVYNEN